VLKLQEFSYPSILLADISQLSSSFSIPTHGNPSFSHAIKVEPDPQNGSIIKFLSGIVTRVKRYSINLSGFTVGCVFPSPRSDFEAFAVYLNRYCSSGGRFRKKRLAPPMSVCESNSTRSYFP